MAGEGKEMPIKPSSRVETPNANQLHQSRKNFLSRTLERLQQKAHQDYVDQYGINPTARDARLGRIGRAIFDTEGSARQSRLSDKNQKNESKPKPSKVDQQAVNDAILARELAARVERSEAEGKARTRELVNEMKDAMGLKS